MTTRLLFISTFPGLADEVGSARHLIRRATAVHLGVRPEARHPAVDDLELLTSEVVTNAVRYTLSGHGGQVRLTLLATDHTFRVEVVDQGGAETKPEVRGDPTPNAERGRGLVLVEALSKEWDVEQEGLGSKVWFEVAHL